MSRDSNSHGLRTNLIVAGSLSLLLGCPSADVRTSGESDSNFDPASFPQIPSPIGLDAEIEGRIDSLIEAMSVEEKVGQVIQAELQSVTPEDVRQYHLGSVLNGGGSFPDADKRATLDDWVEMADAFWEASMDTSDGGQAIPIVWGVDAVHGHNNVFGAVLFPHNIGLGAMADPELAERIGEATAEQIRLTGQDWNFSPTVAVPRDDRWGRTYEGYSEDPEIVAEYAAAMVRGIQGVPGDDDFLGERRVVATAKHFIGDGGTDRGVDRGDTLASASDLLNVHFAGYETALREGVQVVMASFNSWHGQKLHAHEQLLTDVLKDRVGFDGFVVGDWNGHGEVPGCTNADCPAALLAGVDMYMVPEDWRALYGNLLQQVQDGVVPMARLEDAVRRVLRVKLRAGLFERERPSERPLSGDNELLRSEEHRALAREAVRKSLVLLENEGALLPLRPDSKVLVAGTAANSFAEQTGGWTLTWQGTENTNDDFPGATTIWQGIREAVESAGGVATLHEGVLDASEVEADVAIVVYGEGPYAEMFGDIDSLVFGSGGSRIQDLETLQALNEAGIPVVSVFLSGRPLVVNAELNLSEAFVAAWLPGTEGAGVADVLFRSEEGEVVHDFTGRLSFSWPRRAEQVVLNRHDAVYDPLFAYGYGLDATSDVAVPHLDQEYLAEKTAVAAITEFFGRDADGAARFEVAGAELTPTDREVQGDSRRAEWRGGEAGRIFLQLESQLDLSRAAAADQQLVVELKVENAPSDAVYLTQRCGEGCEGTLDVTETLAQRASEDWFSLALPLRCFADAGVDLSRVERPFELATSGALTLVISRVGLGGTGDSTPCPGLE